MTEMKNFFKKNTLLAALAVLLLGLGLGTQAVRAGQPVQGDLKLAPVHALNSTLQATQTPGAPLSQWNPNCVMCHQSPKLNGITQDSLQVSLTVDNTVLDNSVHGDAGLECVSCHTLFTNYPHLDIEQVTCEQCHEQNMTIVVNLPYENRREMQIELNQACYNCHAGQYSANSMHTPVDLTGLVKTPLCTDCHGGHNVQHPTEPPARVVYMCSQCHTTVSAEFLAGEHNSADPKTQTCITCHTPHEIPQNQAEPTPAPQPTPVVEDSGSSFVDEWSYSCTMCHTYPNLIGKAEDASTVSLTVTEQMYSQSIHAKSGLGCAACHETITGYPHSDTIQVPCSSCHSQSDMTAEIIANVPYESARMMSIELNNNCRSCHEDEFEASADSVHTHILENGNLQSPLCSDCHGSHDIQPAVTPPSKSVETCSSCHSSVHSSYLSSVHGAAVANQESPDAPTCAECHDGHAVNGPGSQNFRNNSVSTCLVCHQDTEMMDKYGISAGLFNRNIDNYHSTPASLFTQGSGETTGGLVVCYDCHGSHTIQGSDNQYSTVNSENVTETCQKCHPDASTRFANAGPAHNGSSVKSATAVKWFNGLYSLLIFAGFGLMVVYLGLDGQKRRAVKKSKANQDQANQ